MVLCFGFVLFDLDSSFFYCYGHYVKHGKPSVLSREEGNMCRKTLRFACRALGELLQLTHPCPALPSLMSQIGSSIFHRNWIQRVLQKALLSHAAGGNELTISPVELFLCPITLSAQKLPLISR